MRSQICYSCAYPKFCIISFWNCVQIGGINLKQVRHQKGWNEYGQCIHDSVLFCFVAYIAAQHL